MTREEFIAKAKGYGYDEERIASLLAIYDEIKETLPTFNYEDIPLMKQAKYC